MRWAGSGTNGSNWRSLMRAGALAAALLGGAAAAEAIGPVRPPGPSAVATPARPVAVFGADGRRTLPKRLEPLRKAIGLLFNNESHTVCSAFCVGPKLIATAAHCLFRSQGGEPPDLSEYWFSTDAEARRTVTHIAGFDDGSAPMNVAAGTTRLSLRPPIDATSDWALIRLSRPACGTSFLPVKPLALKEIEAQSRSGKLFQVAYHRDFREWQLALGEACEVRGRLAGVTPASIRHDFLDSRHLVLHRCDTGEASSGSPLLLEAEGGPYVVGISVGTYVQSKVIMRDGKVERSLGPRTLANTAVNAQVFAALIGPVADAEMLAEGPALEALQRRLKALLLYGGPLDGAYGELMRVAIRAYQKANRLPETGLPTEDLWRRIVVAPPLPERKPATRGSMLQTSG